MSDIRAVFFDVGEVVVDESREYGTWADWLGVPRHTFSAVFGAVIAGGGDYRDAFQHFRPGFDLGAERRRREDAGEPESFSEDDVYPDVRPCLTRLREMGLRVGLAGNQTVGADGLLRALKLPVDVIGTSGGWGVEKPSPAFFERLLIEIGHPADSVLYVGDRIDNDIEPAQQLGIQTAHLRRGPWGYILDNGEALDRCLFRLESLGELPDFVIDHNLRSGRASP